MKYAMLMAALMLFSLTSCAEVSNFMQSFSDSPCVTAVKAEKDADMLKSPIAATYTIIETKQFSTYEDLHDYVVEWDQIGTKICKYQEGDMAIAVLIQTKFAENRIGITQGTEVMYCLNNESIAYGTPLRCTG